MKRTLITVVTFLAVTAARAADLGTTFHFNPSLSREANPAVTFFGADPKTYLIQNILGAVVLLFVPLFVYWRARPRSLSGSPSDMWSFASLLLYNEIMSRGKFLRTFFLRCRLPKDWVQLVRLWGFAASWTVVFGSVLGALSWGDWAGYQAIRSFMSVGKYSLLELIACLPVIYVAVMVFIRTEYTDYLHRMRP